MNDQTRHEGALRAARAASYASLAAAFRSGETSPSALLKAGLARLDAIDPQIQAFVCVAREAAAKAAQAANTRWRVGEPLSPIDGMAIGVKDIIETQDMPTGQGSPIWAGFETKRDAASVQALRAAGAAILGKTVTTEFAATEPIIPTCNPHDHARTAGGSSSGSAAAVAAGMVPAALGTQVVGSILRPASYCGCVGFKPSVGALNRSGSYDHLSQSCLGVLAATPADAWAVASAIVERVGGDPGHDERRHGRRLRRRALPQAALPAAQGRRHRERQLPPALLELRRLIV